MLVGIKTGGREEVINLNISQAKPVLDQINEEDKYGNSGDKFAGVGRFVVNGIEGFSNLINKLFEVSVDC